jgi:cell volume regulation protein A
MIFTAFLAYYLWNWSWMHSLLLGAIIGGTSSSVVIPLISRMKLSPRVTTLLSLESAITDAIVVVVGIAILHVITVSPNGNELTAIAHSITSAFSIGATFGLIAGIIWLRILKNIEHGIYDDIITLSFVLLSFAIVESLGGNGAIFALAFGLVLGNGKEISDMLNIKEPMEVGRIMKKFMAQISFFIRTFFFMYLGLLLIIKDLHLIFYSILIAIILLFGRLISSYFASLGDTLLEKNRGILTIILPRGLAAAVLSQLIVTSNISKSYIFSDIIIIVIIITVIISSIGSSIIERSMKNSIDEKEKINN